MSKAQVYRILGIDPGTATTGFGVIDTTVSRVVDTLDYGVIRTQPKDTDSQRLLILQEGIQTLIDTYQPNILAIEKLYAFRNTTTVITVAQARGVVLVNAENYQIPIFEFTPLQIKQAITGYGKAPKKQMQTMVSQILQLSSIPKPDDAADGLAVALCCQASLNYILQTYNS